MKFWKFLGGLMVFVGFLTALTGILATAAPMIDNDQVRRILESFTYQSQDQLLNTVNGVLLFCLNHQYLLFGAGAGAVLLGGLLKTAADKAMRRADGGVRESVVPASGSRRRREPAPTAQAEPPRNNQAEPRANAELSPYAAAQYAKALERGGADGDETGIAAKYRPRSIIDTPSQAAAQSEAMPACPACGTQNPASACFCDHCGARLTGAATAARSGAAAMEQSQGIGGSTRAGIPSAEPRTAAMGAPLARDAGYAQPAAYAQPAPIAQATSQLVGRAALSRGDAPAGDEPNDAATMRGITAQTWPEPLSYAEPPAASTRFTEPPSAPARYGATMSDAQANTAAYRAQAGPMPVAQAANAQLAHDPAWGRDAAPLEPTAIPGDYPLPYAAKTPTHMPATQPPYAAAIGDATLPTAAAPTAGYSPPVQRAAVGQSAYAPLAWDGVALPPSGVSPITPRAEAYPAQTGIAANANAASRPASLADYAPAPWPAQAAALSGREALAEALAALQRQSASPERHAAMLPDAPAQAEPQYGIQQAAGMGESSGRTYAPAQPEAPYPAAVAEPALYSATQAPANAPTKPRIVSTMGKKSTR